MKIIKVLISILLTAAVVLTFFSCSFNVSAVSPYSPRQIADYIISEQTDIPVLNILSPDDDYFSDYVSNIYRLNNDYIENGIIYYADEMIADEISVFLIVDGTNINEISTRLLKYISRRADAFEGYAPKQAAILKNSTVVVRGNYVALLICENPENAKSDFLACFSENPPELSASTESSEAIPAVVIPTITTPEITAGIMPEIPITETAAETTTEITTEITTETTTEAEIETTADTTETATEITEITIETTAETTAEITADIPEVTSDFSDSEDVYNHDAVVTAWKNGDTSALSKKNLLIFNACSNVINEVIKDGMTYFEKELAIHDWIIDRTEYDKEVNSNSPNAKPDPDNNNPYGLLINNKAICTGYASTFKLFMDLLDIECIIVEGKSGISKSEEHAWNMVRIDGNWYCVDITWDDPIDTEPDFDINHKYFNVTSRFMRYTHHYWDESKTPTAMYVWEYEL